MPPTYTPLTVRPVELLAHVYITNDLAARHPYWAERVVAVLPDGRARDDMGNIYGPLDWYDAGDDDHAEWVARERGIADAERQAERAYP